MALKKQQAMLESFSMASMTDVVFLLLVFFMVTSTYIFPTSMEVNLPQSSEQTALKPSTRIFIPSDTCMAVQFGDGETTPIHSEEELVTYLKTIQGTDSLSTVAIYGDAGVEYGRIIEVLNIGAENNIRMVLATTPRAASAPAD